MVQIQSTWFPLYDRNPQTFVPNIFWPSRRLSQSHPARLPRPGQATFIELPLAAVQWFDSVSEAASSEVQRVR